MKVKQRDIILINFPFSDLAGAKVRPALVISNEAYNVKNLDAMVLALTSNLAPHAYKILIEPEDLETGKLPAKSAIRIVEPFSVSQGKVLKIQASVNVEKLEEVKLVMQKLVEQNISPTLRQIKGQSPCLYGTI